MCVFARAQGDAVPLQKKVLVQYPAIPPQPPNAARNCTTLDIQPCAATHAKEGMERGRRQGVQLEGGGRIDSLITWQPAHLSVALVCCRDSVGGSCSAISTLFFLSLFLGPD